LQAVIKRRRFMEPSQEEIAGIVRGNEANMDVLNKFLHSHGLRCEHTSPGKISIPIFLETELNNSQDVIAVWDYFKVFPVEGLDSAFGDGDAHFSLVESYNAINGNVRMTDSYERKRIVISDEVLGSAMNLPAHGFYLVGND